MLAPFSRWPKTTLNNPSPLAGPLVGQKENYFPPIMTWAQTPYKKEPDDQKPQISFPVRRSADDRKLFDRHPRAHVLAEGPTYGREYINNRRSFPRQTQRVPSWTQPLIPVQTVFPPRNPTCAFLYPGSNSSTERPFLAKLGTQALTPVQNDLSHAKDMIVYLPSSCSTYSITQRAPAAQN